MNYPNIDLILNDQHYTSYNLNTDFIDLISDEHIFLSCSQEKIDFTFKQNISDGIMNRFKIVLPYLQKYFNRNVEPGKKYNFVLGLGDVEYNSYGNNIACISLSKKEYMKNILLPNIDFFSKLILLLFSAVSDNDISYESKIDASVFAGASTGGTDIYNKRVRYCLLMNHFPHYAKITDLCQGSLKDWEVIFPNINSVIDSDPLKIKDQLQYKILVNIDGNTLCYSRLYWQMLSNSIPVYIEPDTSTKQFFDRPEIRDCYFSSSIIHAQQNIDNLLLHTDKTIIDTKIQNGIKYCEKYFSDYKNDPEQVIEYIITHILNRLIYSNM